MQTTRTYGPIETRIADLPDAKGKAAIAAALLAEGGPAAIRIQEKKKGKTPPASIVYVARQSLLMDILRKPDEFGLWPYDRSIKDVSFLLSGDTDLYVMRRRILARAFGHDDQSAFDADFDMEAVAADIAGSAARNLALTHKKTGQADIIRHYGQLVPYLIIERVFGTSGSRKASQQVRLMQFVKWLSSKRRLHPDHVTQPMYSVLIASTLMLGHLFENFEGRDRRLSKLAHAVSRQIRQKIGEDMQAKRERPDTTLASKMVHFESEFVPDVLSKEAFDEHVKSILFEFAGTMQLLVSTGFGRVVSVMQDKGITFAEVIELMRDRAQAEAFIRETIRIKAVSGTLTRQALVDTEIAGQPVKKDEYVACMLANAGLDPHAYPEPHEIKMDRDPKSYLQWGPYDGLHACFGQRWSLSILRQMFLHLNLLPEIDFIAGKTGRHIEFGGLPESHLVQFKAGA